MLSTGSHNKAGTVDCVVVDDGGPNHGDIHPLLKLKDDKGGDMAEWPEDLRVREMPEVVPSATGQVSGTCRHGIAGYCDKCECIINNAANALASGGTP